MTNEIEVKEGILVRHPKKPDWGLGKVLVRRGNNATVYFKDDDDADHRTFVLDETQLIIADEQSDPMLDKLPPFAKGAFVTKHKKVTIHEGIKAFELRFPRGFNDPLYLEAKGGELGGERNYKLRAHQRYLDAFGEGNGEALLESGKIDQLRELVQGVTTKDHMNLLSPYESMALRDGLAANDRTAAEFFRTLFAFVANGPDSESFNALADAVKNLPVEPGRARVATWPVLTLLPFLADPDRFMFLKPEPTQACADRLRFDLLYDSEFRWVTYARLLEMGVHLLDQLRPLGARDFIDVQSFMWVIQKY